MTAVRSTKEEFLYRKERRRVRGLECPFCTITEHSEQYVEASASLKIIRNIFPYSIWDGQGVVDHLMIIPTQHTEKLGSLGPEVAVEYIKFVEKYEALGYNLYARAPSSNVKSIVHQHSHLIKLDGKGRKLLFLLGSPFYFRLSR